MSVGFRCCFPVGFAKNVTFFQLPAEVINLLQISGWVEYNDMRSIEINGTRPLTLMEQIIIDEDSMYVSASANNSQLDKLFFLLNFFTRIVEDEETIL